MMTEEQRIASDERWEELMKSADTIKVSYPNESGSGYRCKYYRVNHEDRTLTEISSCEWDGSDG